MLAFDYPQLRDALHAELLTTSKDKREEIFLFHWFLVRFSSMDEAARQGVPRGLRLLNAEPGDEFDGDMHENAWWYQAEVIGEARGDLTINPGDLSLAIQGYNL
jgi:hypothetical protein